MHTEFDSGVSKVKDIVEELSSLPTSKSSRTTKAEDLASQIVIMQASLVRKHDILQKILVQKINYQRLKEEAYQQITEISATTEKSKFKTLEIQNYEHYNIFAKKVKFLNSEIQRLKMLISNSDNIESLQDEIWDDSVAMLNEKQAAIKLQQVVLENMKVEEEISKASSWVAEGGFAVKKGEAEEIVGRGEKV